jgi:hypothetical protein
MTPPSRQADSAHGLPGRELIAVMPLHAITTVYGERGLRARLEFETARLYSPADREKTGKALQRRPPCCLTLVMPSGPERRWRV